MKRGWWAYLIKYSMYEMSTSLSGKWNQMCLYTWCIFYTLCISRTLFYRPLIRLYIMNILEILQRFSSYYLNPSFCVAVNFSDRSIALFKFFRSRCWKLGNFVIYLVFAIVTSYNLSMLWLHSNNTGLSVPAETNWF